jgi:hypothetical protein
MLVYLTDVRSERVIITQVNWISRPKRTLLVPKRPSEHLTAVIWSAAGAGPNSLTEAAPLLEHVQKQRASSPPAASSVRMR